MPTGDCLKALGAEGLWFDSVPTAGSGQAHHERIVPPPASSGRAQRERGASRADEGGSETPPLRKNGPRTPG